MRRALRVVSAALLLAPLATPFLPSGTGAAATATGGDAGAVTVTRTLTRAHLNADGTQTVADTRTVTLQLGQTKALRSRQPISVHWSGAHPTGGVVGDATSSTARLQEYPFVLMECRGVDSPSAPTAQRLSPQTCWTQSAPERFQADYDTGFPAWRLDRRATASDRAASVGAPSPRPKTCGSAPPAEHWLPFVAASGTTYNDNLVGCGTLAPEAANVEGGGQPSNTTYAITEPDGSGSTKFTAWTKEDNASLGCSATVACSLVAIPVMGVSCDDTTPGVPAASRQDCRSAGNYAVGAPLQNSSGNADAVSGTLWWSASNWDQRISVPLSFAPAAEACDLVGKGGSVDLYGSELLVQATTQWRPSFCLGAGRTPFKHVQVGEPQAKNLLSQGTIGAGFLSEPPAGGWKSPVVTAPTALSGFSISYTVDDDKHQPVTDLRLTPRLIAKLLTQSYPAVVAVKDEYAALSKNPIDLSHDPEFRALNPGVGDVLGGPSAAELFDVSSDSDVVHRLTAYLDDDPEARAFLDGTPDPWGMVVNPSYKGIALPVDSWPQKDSFEPKAYYASGVNACLQNDPVPYLPLVSAPTARLATITTAVQFALANPQVVCQDVPGLDNGVGAKLVALGRQRPGFRFLLGVTSLGDARRYQLDSAALQVRSTVAPGAAFSSPAGRTFVAPDDSSLRAAGALLKPDATTGSWALSPAALRTGSTAAYPGTMLVSTAVRTSGLKATDAAAYAAFLRFVGGDGQRAGLDNGQLPPGFLPLTAANGLAPLATYTVRAASAVAAQQGDVPPLTGPAAGQPASRDGSGPAADPGLLAAVPGGGSPGGSSGPSSSPQGPLVAAPAGRRSPGGTPLPQVATSAVRTPGALSGVSGLLLPLLLGAGLLGLLGTRLLDRVSGGRR